MYKILKLFFTSNPIKRFQMECQLMLYYTKRSRFIRKRFQRRLYYIYSCDISHSAQIHESVTFGHPIGIVIGSNAVIEKKCSIYQNVTIGANFASDNKMPRIKQNTKISAGAKIIGDIIIGENCIIGANAVVTKSIPDNSIVVGANKIISQNI